MCMYEIDYSFEKESDYGISAFHASGLLIHMVKSSSSQTSIFMTDTVMTKETLSQCCILNQGIMETDSSLNNQLDN